MPLCVARTTTSRPLRKAAVRSTGQGRAGCRRATRTTPHKYSAATTATTTVTTGANCQLLTASVQLNGGSSSLPMRRRVPLRPVVAASGAQGRRCGDGGRRSNRNFMITEEKHAYRMLFLCDHGQLG